MCTYTKCTYHLNLYLYVYIYVDISSNTQAEYDIILVRHKRLFWEIFQIFSFIDENNI